MRKILVIGWLISSGQVWCDSPQCDPSNMCSGTQKSICIADKQADGTAINRWACLASTASDCSNVSTIQSALSEENWKENPSLRDYNPPQCEEVTDGYGCYAKSGSLNFSPDGTPCRTTNADFQSTHCCFIILLPTTTESTLCKKGPCED